ncbi:hypothetical protein ACSVBT_06450 [Afipia sp. TerB]
MFLPFLLRLLVVMRLSSPGGVAHEVSMPWRGHPVPQDTTGFRADAISLRHGGNRAPTAIRINGSGRAAGKRVDGAGGLHENP